MEIGSYVLETRLAVGGTAEVYLARRTDAPNSPRVVVKRPLPDFLADEEGRAMFVEEGRLQAAVAHPNVVRVLDRGATSEGEPYLVLEHVDGIDLFRLLRRSRLDAHPLPPGIAAYIGHEIATGLAAVHEALDERGQSLRMVHRDVTPSNVYLARDGAVKLGDFGIALGERATFGRSASAVLKGKYAYLAPEQVSAEPFDGRADIFSLATVIAEMVLGEPLWPGGGQLAILLAIRDCRIDPLTAIKSRLPPQLYGAIVRALAREPSARFPDARAFAEALAPLVPTTAKRDLAALVATALVTRSETSVAAIRIEDLPCAETMTRDERATGEYSTLPSFARTARDELLGPWTFAALVEQIATGSIGRGDLVDYMGRGYQSIETIDELVRFLPAQTPATSDLQGPVDPDWTLELGESSALEAMLTLIETGGDGVLIADREGMGSERGGRKELYVAASKLHHVASTNASELLGEYLVRRGKLSRSELDMALAVLPRNQGRMGDTLISLGLVSSVDVFQAIREQGRDRVADLFMWKQGRASFYRGQRAAHVEFPLDIDLPSLVVAGMEAAVPGEKALEKFRGRLHDVVGPGPRDRPKLIPLRWPPQVAAVEALARRPRRLSELLSDATRGGQTTAGSVLRMLEILIAARLVALTGR
ncbi:hypothetical protein BH09MYX1_BH09MYX1_47490 [soil metagenome]